MAGSLSNQMETDVLKWMFTADPVTRPTAWYLALFTDAAGRTDDQPTSEATSATHAGYARQQITGWTVSGDTAKNNSKATFTASGAWPTVRYWAVFDAVTGGRMIDWGDILGATGQAEAQTLANGNKLEFDVNQLTVRHD